MIYWSVFDRLMYTAFVGDADVVAEAKRQVLFLGLQYLVGGLQLFVRGLELFV